MVIPVSLTLPLSPSILNHSAKLDVARWCVVGVMGFVTKQSVGTKLCISNYVERGVLSEPTWRRTQVVAMNFDDCTADDDEQNYEGPDISVVISDVYTCWSLINWCYRRWDKSDAKTIYCKHRKELKWRLVGKCRGVNAIFTISVLYEPVTLDGGELFSFCVIVVKQDSL